MELVAEIGPANGDLGYALEAVHAAAESGFQAVKGQVFHRDMLVTPTAKTYAQEGITTPDTQYEDFEAQLSYDEWEKVQAECESAGLDFFFSAFDKGAVHFGEAIGVKRYKIASGDLTYKQLHQRIAETGKEVVVSTGAATGPEIVRALSWHDGPVTLLACTLSYPCEPRFANLRRMEALRDLVKGDPFGISVGYSDHTYGTDAIVRAEELGAVMVEKHFTITPGEGGDHDFAVTPQQMRAYWDHKNDWRGTSVYDGDGLLSPSHAEQRALYGARRSMHAGRDLLEGNVLGANHVKMLRPAAGIEPWRLDDYVGRPLQRSVAAGQPITEECF